MSVTRDIVQAPGRGMKPGTLVTDGSVSWFEDPDSPWQGRDLRVLEQVVRHLRGARSKYLCHRWLPGPTPNNRFDVTPGISGYPGIPDFVGGPNAYTTGYVHILIQTDAALDRPYAPGSRDARPQDQITIGYLADELGRSTVTRMTELADSGPSAVSLKNKAISPEYTRLVDRCYQMWKWILINNRNELAGDLAQYEVLKDYNWVFPLILSEALGIPEWESMVQKGIAKQRLTGQIWVAIAFEDAAAWMYEKYMMRSEKLVFHPVHNAQQSVSILLKEMMWPAFREKNLPRFTHEAVHTIQCLFNQDLDVVTKTWNGWLHRDSVLSNSIKI